MIDDLNHFWERIHHVLLDMDGTLLDRYFDDYFWEHYLPNIFAKKNGLPEAEALDHLLSRYKQREGTLDWTDLDFWSTQLDLDIPALKLSIDHLIKVHPFVIAFLNFCRRTGKRVFLVTNAHGKTLDIKMKKTALTGYFDRIVCSQEVGMAKENPLFWEKLGGIIPYDPDHALLADDTEAVLASAQLFGIRELIYVARPSSRKSPEPSLNFRSIHYFSELIPE
ncbi:MAG: HAD hydrolase-like protein [Proteobacteria bacterium]|nr:HAD hydrolase-like protein [Pseudomonadota bacterium]MBU1687651.1 HAD hydrolase-like protein [Pseudomonadota bacterium]